MCWQSPQRSANDVVSDASGSAGRWARAVARAMGHVGHTEGLHESFRACRTLQFAHTSLTLRFPASDMNEHVEQDRTNSESKNVQCGADVRRAAQDAAQCVDIVGPRIGARERREYGPVQEIVALRGIFIAITVGASELRGVSRVTSAPPDVRRPRRQSPSGSARSIIQGSRPARYDLARFDAAASAHPTLAPRHRAQRK